MSEGILSIQVVQSLMFFVIIIKNLGILKIKIDHT